MKNPHVFLRLRLLLGAALAAAGAPALAQRFARAHGGREHTRSAP